MVILSIAIAGCSSSKKVTKEQYDDIPKNAIEKEARTWLGTKYRDDGTNS